LIRDFAALTPLKISTFDYTHFIRWNNLRLRGMP
jgi:hypothetical protein